MRAVVAEQLTIFGLWEEARSPAPPASVPAEAAPSPHGHGHGHGNGDGDGDGDESPAPPHARAVVDPRQAELFVGPQALRGALYAACERLDAPAARRRHAELMALPGQRWTEPAAAWADGIDWLVGAPAGSLTVDEAVGRALACYDPAERPRRFPSLNASVLLAIVQAALERAAVRLLAERGPLACAPNGEPAGWLLLRAGSHDAASVALTAALAACPPGDPVNPGAPRAPGDGSDASDPARAAGFPVARAWSWLGESEWGRGRAETAVRAHVRALLTGSVLPEHEIACAPILDLLDAAEDLELPQPLSAWVPALADLRGLASLPPEAASAAPGDSPARRFAAELARYRRAHAAGGLAPSERIDSKRRMTRLAPALRELIRPL